MVEAETLVITAVCGLVVLVAALTLATQLELDAKRVLKYFLSAAMRYARCIVGSRKKQAPASRVRDGKRARRSKRRRERLESMLIVAGEGRSGVKLATGEEAKLDTLPAVESAFQLYKQHLRISKQALCVQLQNMKARILECPCAGCGVVNAKRNCSYNYCASCCRDSKNSVCRAHGTGYQAAVSAVEAAATQKHFEFDLSYAHLRQCPPNIPNIGEQLVSLNLSNNRLSHLPEDIGSLCSLEELFLQYNCLTSLPESICELSNLMELDVKNNRLTNLPCDFGSMTSLIILSLTNNHITSLPQSVGKLCNLQELSLHSNHLTELPDKLCDLVNVKIIYAGENRLKTLPVRFGELVDLEELDVSGCELVTLPQSLSKCASLVRLWLSNNRLVGLPHHIGDLQLLKELHVRNNCLKCFPASIQQLQLYTFTAQNNCLVDEQTAKTWHRNPSPLFPPLLELSARAVLRHKLSWEPGAIPQVLDQMLHQPSACSRCGGPFFRYFSSMIIFRTVGVCFRLPLYQQFCSPHPNTRCS